MLKLTLEDGLCEAEGDRDGLSDGEREGDNETDTLGLREMLSETELDGL